MPPAGPVRPRVRLRSVLTTIVERDSRPRRPVTARRVRTRGELVAHVFVTRGAADAL
jgi:hypothetical protein